MATPPEGWSNKQPTKPNIFEANISQVNIPTGSVSIVAETDKTTGSYTVYNTALPNFAGGRSAIYTVSASGAVNVENKSLYDTLKTQGNITTLDNSIKPRAFQINQSFGTDAEKKTVSESNTYKSLANQAKNAEGTTTITAVDLNIQGTGKKGENSFGNYTYPQGLGSTKQDVIKFSMLEYKPQKLETKGAFEGGALGGFTSERDKDRIILGTVTLPIPSGISESNGVNWGNETMSPFEALAANVALTSIQKGLTAGGEQAAAMLKGAGGTGDVKTAVAFKFSEAATGVGNLLSRTQGAVFNPNLELLFNGPTLRPFTFTFKMSARSETEAKQIIRIIRFFKQGMSPQKTESTLYLKAPHTFRIQYLYRPGGKDNIHPYIGQIKECALQNLIVNYTPEGQYATFSDGVMVSYEMQMQFQELEPVFNEDYGGEFPADLKFK